MGKRTKQDFDKRPRDYYATIDPDAVKPLIPFIRGLRVAEPCAGDGDLAEIWKDRKKYYLGSFDCEVEAAKAYDEKAKELFEIYCATCHGNNGNGNGKLVEREKFLGVPSYKDRVITEGSIYHVITYGLNSMGSHANQLSPQERWLVTDYVLKLKSEL